MLIYSTEMMGIKLEEVFRPELKEVKYELKIEKNFNLYLEFSYL